MLDPLTRHVIAHSEIEATIDAITRIQLPTGCIPWFPSGPADPWDHVEAAMALTVGNRVERAEAAYRWLGSVQRTDGAWAAEYRDGRVVDATLDANFSSYIAVGLWHHWLATADRSFVAEMWPHLEKTIDFTLDLQSESGAILWARDLNGRPWPRGLLTSSSCIYLSLRCAIGLATVMQQERPDWELALPPLQDAIANRPDAFEPKHRYSMDWYYPVLGGALAGDAANKRLRSRWDEFVVDGWGVRCVDDHPWVTTGETCELVLALDSMGLVDQAVEVFDWLRRLRAEDGAYWTGATFPSGVVWPREKPTWGSAAVVLAADALGHASRTSGLFRGEGLPAAARVSDTVRDPL